jgi:hypothetical protein
MPGLISPLPSERSEFNGKLLNAAHKQKHVEQDALLLENRISLLKKEEQRAWRKIQQTKKRADEIVVMRRDNEMRLERKQMMAQQVQRHLKESMPAISSDFSVFIQAEERERELADEHLRMGESSRRTREKNMQEVYNRKREEVQRARQERQMNRVEVRTQQAEEYQQKMEIRSTVKKREEDIRIAREAERQRIDQVNKEMYEKRVHEKMLATRRKEKEVSKMEKMEMQLIQKLKNTQQLQQRAFYELENALNGDV